jgi:hypothetical protein
VRERRALARVVMRHGDGGRFHQVRNVPRWSAGGNSPLA